MIARLVFFSSVCGFLLLGSAACRGEPLSGDRFEDRKAGQSPDPE